MEFIPLIRPKLFTPYQKGNTPTVETPIDIKHAPKPIQDLNIARINVDSLMLLFDPESPETVLPLSVDFLKSEALNISALFGDLTTASPESKDIAIVPDSLLNQAEIYQIMLSIAAFNNRFINSHALAANNWLNQNTEASNSANHTRELPLNNLHELQYHLGEIANSSNSTISDIAIKSQLEQISKYFKYLIRIVDPNDPKAYFSDDINKKDFKRCLDLIQLIVKLVKVSWEEYKTRCDQEKTKLNPQIKLIVNTTVRNFLHKLTAYDFPKAIDLEIPGSILAKYENTLPPEVLVLTTEERKDKSKLHKAWQLARQREREEKKLSSHNDEQKQQLEQSSEKFDYNWFIDTLFDGSDGNVADYSSKLRKVLEKKLNLFTPDLKVKYPEFYNQISQIEYDLQVVGNIYINDYNNQFSSTEEYSRDDRLKFTEENSGQLKKLLKRAVFLNQMCVEKYGITTADEILNIKITDYIRQIANYIDTHPEDLQLKKLNLKKF